MNHIRQALHNAAREFAKQAHIAWCNAEIAHRRMFSYAVTGNHIERRLETIVWLNAHGQYRSHIKKEQRAREMMK